MLIRMQIEDGMPVELEDVTSGMCTFVVNENHKLSMPVEYLTLMLRDVLANQTKNVDNLENEIILRDDPED